MRRLRQAGAEIQDISGKARHEDKRSRDYAADRQKDDSYDVKGHEILPKLREIQENFAARQKR